VAKRNGVVEIQERDSIGFLDWRQRGSVGHNGSSRDAPKG
jgi:hypothetical protein